MKPCRLLPLPFGIALSLSALSAGAAVLPAPITSVTVYSDRARVTRVARIDVSGTERVELPLLLDTVDPRSIRVEIADAQGVEVQRLDLSPVPTSQVPVSEAKQLLDKLEHLDDQVARIKGERGAHQAQLDVLRRLSPAVPQGEPLRPVPRLNPGGWTAVLEFLDKRSDQAQERLRETDERLHRLAQERQALVERVRLLGLDRRRGGFRVAPTLSGHGSARLVLTYEVGGARWLPVYDIQLQPDKGRVEALFSGQVSQETGEDWLDAELTLSTAVPATVTQLPRIRTWKIGERERFIPVPVARSQAVLDQRGPPVSSPRPRPVANLEGDALAQRLLGRAGLSPSGQLDAGILENDYKNDGAKLSEKRREPAKNEIDGEMDRHSPPPPPDEAPARPSVPSPVAKAGKEQVSTRNARTFSSMASVMGPEAMADLSPPTGVEISSSLIAAPVPREAVGLLPPQGYRPPSFAANLPASLAGGHDLHYTGLAKETVRSGQGARRVALWSRTWPVNVLRKIYPALAPEAFLVAEIKSPEPRALPGGQANLFVGADPAGVAWLGVVAPGEVFTLPLGLDRAMRPVRNVQVTTSEKGVFSKDEVSQYVVTTEVVNPYPTAAALRVVDQLPLTNDKNVEIKLLRTDPPAQPDRYTGALEWRISLPPGGKAQTTFVYTLRRPKGYQLHQ